MDSPTIQRNCQQRVFGQCTYIVFFLQCQEPKASYSLSKINKHKRRSHSCFMVSSMKFALILLPFLPVVHVVTGKSSLRTFNGRRHDLFNRYRVSVSQMTSIKEIMTENNCTTCCNVILTSHC
jgi:hypothetical protein